MNISKTTINFANKRNVDLFIDDEKVLHLTVDVENNDCTAVNYKIENDALFFNLKHDQRLEDLPQWIDSEKGLRQLIDYVAKTHFGI